MDNHDFVEKQKLILELLRERYLHTQKTGDRHLLRAELTVGSSLLIFTGFVSSISNVVFTYSPYLTEIKIILYILFICCNLYSIYFGFSCLKLRNEKSFRPEEKEFKKEFKNDDTSKMVEKVQKLVKKTIENSNELNRKISGKLDNTLEFMGYQIFFYIFISLFNLI